MLKNIQDSDEKALLNLVLKLRSSVQERKNYHKAAYKYPTVLESGNQWQTRDTAGSRDGGDDRFTEDTLQEDVVGVLVDHPHESATKESGEECQNASIFW
uniref:Uncharacterized protein n=1 Tax=Panagrellus redivivus TaxID=6233 RepID=A0A7E4VNN7_PANRE